MRRRARRFAMVVWLVGACRPEAVSVAAPPAASVEVAPAREGPPPLAEPDVLAGLRARFAALQGYEPAPAIAPPPWLRQGTLWLADARACRPIWRTDVEDIRRRELLFCSVVQGDEEVDCRQRLEIDGSLRFVARHECRYGASPRALARDAAEGRGKGGGGGWGRSLPRPAASLALEDMPREPDPGWVLEWRPIAVAAEHAVFADTWRFTVRAARARVEQACEAGSIERARGRLRQAMPRASASVVAAALDRRFGIAADGRRRCHVVEGESIARGRWSPALAFDERVRNVPTQDVVDCSEPCPEDQEVFERERAYLAETAFVTAAPSHRLVVYRSKAACEAGALRSTLALSDAECRRAPRR